MRADLKPLQSLLAVLPVLIAASANAQPAQLAVFDIPPVAGLRDREWTAITDEVAAHVGTPAGPYVHMTAGGYVVIPLAKTRVHAAAEKRCTDPACQRRVASHVGATQMLVVTVDKRVLSRCGVSATIVDVQTGADLRRAKTSAAGCSSTEIEAAAIDAACDVATQSTLPAAQAAQSPGEAAARAAFALAECRLQRFLRRTVAGPIDTLFAQEKQLARHALVVRTAFQKVPATKSRRWDTASRCRQGLVFDYTATVIRDVYIKAPIPTKVTRLGSAAVQIYTQQLGQLVGQRVPPLVATAEKHYRECIAAARAMGVLTNAVAEAYQRMHVKEPQNYP